MQSTWPLPPPIEKYSVYQLLADLYYSQQKAIPIFKDNIECIFMRENTSITRLSKYINIQYYFNYKVIKKDVVELIIILIVD